MAKKRKKRNADYNYKVDYSLNGLKDAIQRKSLHLTEKIIQKIDKTLISQEIFDLAYESKNRDIIRLISDYTQDTNLLYKNKDKLQQSILKQRDIRNLVGQILSSKDNESFDKEMQSVVYDLYVEVVEKHYKNGNINKNFPIDDFKKSMEQSQKFLFNQKSINLDSIKDGKFLLLPVYCEGHAFSAVARKLNDDKYSLTFANLGARPFEQFGDNKYKEYVYTKADAERVLKQFSLNVRLDYPEKAVSVEKAYKTFEKNALENYTLNVDSLNQKTGNCFTKNIEKSIRFAISSMLAEVEYKNFDMDKLRLNAGEPFKPKFLKPLYHGKDKYANKKELSTINLKTDLMEALSKKFPQYDMIIKNALKTYKHNKEQNISLV